MTGVLSLGSNLGDREAHLRAAVDYLSRQFPVRAMSPLYETDPVTAPGARPQPAYLNAVLVVDLAGATPADLLAAAHEAEEMRGRLRGERWGPRTLDVDVVAVDALTSSDPRLTLPHPRAHERAFVLVPWSDVDPDAVVPGRGPVWSLLRSLDRSGVRRWRP
ncbi:MAG: 2-amino-4-hydroxy-6-hydroxymethyldihydropteridine diphosphokinase [Frankiales bacterium]|nr:2-amino-4-hydroxy-6-hydroxymethyldihydropteridine diphosphokinase [Frankiales bacterium]